jgi:hypothetical protein
LADDLREATVGLAVEILLAVFYLAALGALTAVVVSL